MGEVTDKIIRLLDEGETNTRDLNAVIGVLLKERDDALAILATGAEPRCPKCGHPCTMEIRRWFSENGGVNYEGLAQCCNLECEEQVFAPITAIAAGLQHALRERRGEVKG